jgi:lipid-A-disaccharide synthase-like uncharacterized protein
MAERLRQALQSGEFWWVAFGFAAQVMFFARFFIQWVVSERRRKSVIPDAFWYLSLAGGLMLLTYAIHRRDPVFIVGQSAGAFIYLRNIVLIRRERRKGAAPAADPAAPPHDRDPAGG